VQRGTVRQRMNRILIYLRLSESAEGQEMLGMIDEEVERMSVSLLVSNLQLGSTTQ